MFDDAAYDDFYSRFRTFEKPKISAPGLISDISLPGAIVSPTDATQRVIDDLERISHIKFHNPTVHNPAARLVNYKTEKPLLSPKNTSKPKIKFQNLLKLLALVSIAVGLCLVVAGWNSNTIARQQAARLTTQASASSNPGAAPSSTPIAPSAISTYSVGPSLPKYIDIPKMSIHARILSLGTTKNGSLAAPGNIFDTGWYNQSAKPGQNGAMLVDGHISNWQAKGVFYGLDKLTPGDTIKITRGDGQVFSYNVVKTQTVNSDQVNMASLLTSQDTSRPGLNIISCSGDVIPGTSEFNKRIIIYALQT